MNHIFSSNSIQIFKNGKFEKNVEEEEILNGKRINHINYNIHNDKKYIITKGRKNNKTFSYKRKIKNVSYPNILGMPTFFKKTKRSKKKRNISQKK